MLRCLLLVKGWNYLNRDLGSHRLLLNNDTARRIRDKVRVLWSWLYNGSGDSLTLYIFDLPNACCDDLAGFWDFQLHFLRGQLFEANLPDGETLRRLFQSLLQPKKRS